MSNFIGWFLPGIPETGFSRTAGHRLIWFRRIKLNTTLLYKNIITTFNYNIIQHYYIKHWLISARNTRDRLLQDYRSQIDLVQKGQTKHNSILWCRNTRDRLLQDYRSQIDLVQRGQTKHKIRNNYGAIQSLIFLILR